MRVVFARALFPTALLETRTQLGHEIEHACVGTLPRAPRASAVLPFIFALMIFIRFER